MRLTLQIEELVVSSFATQDPAAAATWAKLCTADISTCPRTGADACICTADISTCPRTGTCYGTNDINACDIAIGDFN